MSVSQVMHGAKYCKIKNILQKTHKTETAAAVEKQGSLKGRSVDIQRHQSSKAITNTYYYAKEEYRL